MSSAAGRRVLIAISVCVCTWLALTAPAAGHVGRGIDPNQGLSLVEVNLPSKLAAMRLQLSAHRYKVEFNEHYLRRNSNGTVTATVFGTKRVSPGSPGPATTSGRRSRARPPGGAVAEIKRARRAERRASAAARGKSSGRRPTRTRS